MNKLTQGLLHNVQWMSCNPILSGFGRSIESHSGDYGSIFSFQRHQSGATNRRYDIMQQTQHMRDDVKKYMKYYNLDRLHSSNGDMSPINFENSLKKVSGWT